MHSLAMAAALTALTPAVTKVEIEIYNTPSISDDYVCWKPVPARARLAPGADSETEITLRNDDSSKGKIEFSSGSGFSSELALKLPVNGDWLGFQVRGKFGHPSIADKDTIIEARNAKGRVGAHKLMVRVRKNAQDLSGAEVERFLDALMILRRDSSRSDGGYEKFQNVHEAILGAAHSGQGGSLRVDVRNFGFLTWHRGFLLHLERSLQSIDASVSIPYWQFDRPAAAVFSRKFLGAVDTDGLVEFDSHNPLSKWATISEPDWKLRRNADKAIWVSGAGDIFNEALLLNTELFAQLSSANGVEKRHDDIHSRAGGRGGQLGQMHQAVRDPTFFLLHSNVDRVWAAWQQKHKRFNPEKTDTYPLKGKFVSHVPVPEGSVKIVRFVPSSWGAEYMWPWSDLPAYPPLPEHAFHLPRTPISFSMPSSTVPGAARLNSPTNADMVDLWGEWSADRGWLGYCYDSISYPDAAPQ